VQNRDRYHNADGTAEDPGAAHSDAPISPRHPEVDVITEVKYVFDVFTGCCVFCSGEVSVCRAEVALTVQVKFNIPRHPYPFQRCSGTRSVFD